MNIPDTHPLLLSNLKAQHDASVFLRGTAEVLAGYGTNGARRRPWRIDIGVRKFGSWCYCAAMLNAAAFAAVPLRLYVRAKQSGAKRYQTRAVKKSRKDYLLGYGREAPARSVLAKFADFGEQFEEVTEPHPALMLLKTANAWHNGFDLSELKLLYLQMTGNHYQMHVIDRRLRVPVEVWPLPAQHVKVRVDEGGDIAGYTYGREPGKQLDAEDVIHWKLPNLEDVYYGKGRLEAVWSAVGLSESKRTEDIAVKENMSRPDWLVAVEGAQGDALTQIENSVEQRLRGAHNRGRMLAVSGKVTATALNQPVGELGDPNRIIEEIAAGFGVPITKLLANDPNRANAETGDAGWLRDTILPYCQRDEEQLNARYLPLWDVPEGDAVLAYDNPVPKNETAETERRVKHVSGGIMQPNEARAELGLEPVEGGDTLLVPSGVVPIGQAGANPLAGLFTVSPNTPTQDAQGAPTGEPSVGAAADVQSTVLNGAQMTAMADIVARVAAGEIPRDAGVQMLATGLQITPEEAERIMGTAGTSKPTTPNPNPNAEAEPIKAEPDAPDEPEDVDDETKIAGPITTKAISGDELIPLLRSIFVEQEAEALGWAEGKTIASLPESKWEQIAGQQKSHPRLVTKDDDRRDEEPNPTITQPLPTTFIDLRKWDKRIVEAVMPVVEGYLRQTAKAVAERLALSNDVWQVVDRNLPKAAEQLSLRLAESTNRTTGLQINEALSQLREEIRTGIVQGDTPGELKKRVQSVFTEASDKRAETIARTEATRARHTAEIHTARQSGAVKAKRWLLSADACPICEAIAAQTGKGVPLDSPYARTDSPDYPTIDSPPAHPNCQCSQQLVLSDEYEQ